MVYKRSEQLEAVKAQERHYMSLQLPATGRERESGKESQGRVARNPGIQERKEGKNEGWKQGCKDSTNQRKD